MRIQCVHLLDLKSLQEHQLTTNLRQQKSRIGLLSFPGPSCWSRIGHYLSCLGLSSSICTHFGGQLHYHHYCVLQVLPYALVLLIYMSICNFTAYNRLKVSHFLIHQSTSRACFFHRNHNLTNLRQKLFQWPSSSFMPPHPHLPTHKAAHTS